MAKAYSVKTRFTANDQVSGVLQRMGKSGQKALGGLASSAKIAGTALAASAAVGVGLAARSFVAFDDSVTAAAAKFGGAFLPGTEGFKELGKAAREIGATTEFSAADAAKGLDYLAMAGFSATESMSLLPDVVNLATVAGTDLATATDIASDAMGAFGLNAGTAEEKAANLARLNDVMAKTTVTANTDLVGLFEAVKKGAPAFTAAGQRMETFNALVGVMANSGVKGEESGTMLRNVMLRLADPTNEAAGVLDQLGVKVQDSQGNFRDVVDILADFEGGLVGMGDAQRTAALSTVFGARAVTGVNLLLQEGSEKLRSYRSDLENASGAAEDMADVIRSSLGNQLKGVASAATEVGFQFIELFQGDISSGLTALTERLRSLDLSQFQGVVDSWKAAFASLDFTPISSMFAGVNGAAASFAGSADMVAGVIQTLINISPVLIKGFLAYVAVTNLATTGHRIYLGVLAAVNTAKVVGNLVSKSYIGTLMGLLWLEGKDIALKGVKTAALWAMNTATTAASLAVKGLGIAMKVALGPIGWIIAGVAAVAAGVVWMVQNWDTVGPALQRFGQAALGVFRTVGGVVFDYMIFPMTVLLKLLSAVPGKVGALAGQGLDMIGDAKSMITGKESDLFVNHIANAAADIGSQSAQSSHSSVDVNIKDQTGRAEFGPKQGSFSGANISLQRGLQY